MEDLVTRFVADLIGRLTGPLSLRLFLQPAMAMFFACRDGLMDAREGRPPHFWRMVTGPPEARRRRVQETMQAVLKVFLMAVVVDCIYQWLVFKWVYPFEAMVTAVILAVVPYVPVRGVVNRIARSWSQPERGASR
jgi:hypothetical protein